MAFFKRVQKKSKRFVVSSISNLGQGGTTVSADELSFISTVTW